MLKRIVSKNNNTFLFEDIPNKIRNGIGIASGESILLSIYENDSFLFSIDINLIHYADIAIEEDPSELEKDFFEFMREKNEVKYKKSLVDKYQLSQYIHFLPRVKYKERIISDAIRITGFIKYPESSFNEKVVRVLLKDKEIPLDKDNSFFYEIKEKDAQEKFDFLIELPKQTIKRSFVRKTKKK